MALGLSDLAGKNVKIDSLFIDEGFGSLDPAKRQIMAEFSKLRNKLFHADFVALMKLLKITPTGRKMLQIGGKLTRVELKKYEILEAVLSTERNNGFTHMRMLAEEVKEILGTIILGIDS